MGNVGGIFTRQSLTPRPIKASREFNQVEQQSEVEKSCTQVSGERSPRERDPSLTGATRCYWSLPPETAGVSLGHSLLLESAT